jgi:hypothetical protein
LLGPLLGQIPGTNTTLGKDLVGIPAAIVKALVGKLSATSGAPAGTAPANATGSVSIGQQMAAAMGWTGLQWNDLYALWMRESGWNYQARNASSGAYGIPQSLPADKMASAGSDWQSNPATQIKWGLGYIHDRYGSPAGAWAHEGSAGWYDQGGYLPPGSSIVHNGTGKPEPVLTSQQWDAVGNGGSSIHIDNLTVSIPAQAMKLNLLSPTDRTQVARSIRDELVKLEGGTRR